MGDNAEDDPVRHRVRHVERIHFGDIGRVKASPAVGEQFLRRGRIGDDIVRLLEDAVDEVLGLVDLLPAAAVAQTTAAVVVGTGMRMCWVR